MERNYYKEILTGDAWSEEPIEMPVVAGLHNWIDNRLDQSIGMTQTGIHYLYEDMDQIPTQTRSMYDDVIDISAQYTLTKLIIDDKFTHKAKSGERYDLNEQDAERFNTRYRQMLERRFYDGENAEASTIYFGNRITVVRSLWYAHVSLSHAQLIAVPSSLVHEEELEDMSQTIMLPNLKVGKLYDTEQGSLRRVLSAELVSPIEVMRPRKRKFQLLKLARHPLPHGI